MSLDIFNDAFKSLSILNENLFDTSTLGVTKLHSFMDDDFEEDTVDIIDPDASTDEELSDSYIGKVIVDCNVCHSHIFKDRDELDIDESGLVNGEDMCPYCGEQEGFVIIGQIEAFNANSEEESEEEPVEDAIEEPEVEEIADEDDEAEDEKVEESMTESLNEGAADNDLASRVLAYLDKIEARGELTEDAGKFAYPDVYKKLEKLLQGRKSVIINNIERDRNVAGSIRRFLTDYMKVKTTYLSGSIDDIPTVLQDALDSSDVVLIDEADRIHPKHLSEVISAMTGFTTPIIVINNGVLDSAFLSKFPNLNFNGVESPIKMEESMNNVKVETDDSIVTVNSDDGKVTVTTEPAGAAMPEGEGEMIAPLSDEDMDSIMSADTDVPVEGEEIPADIDAIEEPVEDMPLEDEEVDIDMEEIDEESLDNLGESYLKKVYENVDSYKTNSSYMRGDKIIVEGVIKFTSGKEKKTGFILEAKSADNRGRVTFSGYNAHLTNDKSAYLFEGRVADKKLTFNKLSYRYALNENLISGRVYRR